VAIFTQYWPILSLCSDTNIGAILCPMLGQYCTTCFTNIGPIFMANIGPILLASRVHAISYVVVCISVTRDMRHVRPDATSAACSRRSLDATALVVCPTVMCGR